MSILPELLKCEHCIQAAYLPLFGPVFLGHLVLHLRGHHVGEQSLVPIKVNVFCIKVVEVLALDQLEIKFQSYFLQVVEADQVLWDIHWAVLSHTMSTDRILQIEIELEAIGAGTLGVRLLPKLDRIEPISNSQILCSLCPNSCDHPICINSCSNEEPTRLQAARDVL